MNIENKDYFYLTNEQTFPLADLSFGGNDNTVVVGDTGSGKTMSTVLPFLLHVQEHSVVVTLSKKHLADKLQDLFQQKGYQVNVINLANPTESKVSYDLLQGVRTEQDIVFISKALLGAPGSHEDRYWYETASSVLTAEIAYVIQDKKRKNKVATFSDVLKLHQKLVVTECASGSTQTSLDAFFACEERFYPDNLASRCWKTIQGLPPKTLSCVLSTLNTALDKMFTEEVKTMMSKENALDIPRIGEEKTAVFVITSAVNPSMNHFVNLFYADVFKQLFEHAEAKGKDGVLKVPVHVVCDDFACGAKIPDFAKYISIFRAKSISVTLLLQSESQLASMYSSYEAQTILNNCANYVFFGSMDMDTCRSLSVKTNRPVDDIMFMPLDNVIVLRRGQKPYFGKRYRVLEDEVYQRLFERNKEFSK